ncbi:MAG: peroxide stress protein YaaA [Pseudomonadota bacterium]
MIILLSPAKTLDYDSKAPLKKFSEPQFQSESLKLIGLLKKRSASEIRSLMKLSPALAELNVERYRAFRKDPAPDMTKQAIYAFKGDVYLGLDATTLSARDINWAQRRLRILSGLYGVLRPLDRMQPYRLEMGTRLQNARGQNLYDFWQSRLTDALAGEVAQAKTKLCVNLASNEYFGAIDADALGARILTPKFLDYSRGDYRFLSFFAKKARGLMARWLIEERVTTAKAIADFDVDGYRFCPERSSTNQPVFIRDANDK